VSESERELRYVVKPGASTDEWLVVHAASGHVVARLDGCLRATELAERLTADAHRISEAMLR
jgi:hypothetical protein